MDAKIKNANIVTIYGSITITHWCLKLSHVNASMTAIINFVRCSISMTTQSIPKRKPAS